MRPCCDCMFCTTLGCSRASSNLRVPAAVCDQLHSQALGSIRRLHTATTDAQRLTASPALRTTLQRHARALACGPLWRAASLGCSVHGAERFPSDALHSHDSTRMRWRQQRTCLIGTRLCGAPLLDQCFQVATAACMPLLRLVSQSSRAPLLPVTPTGCEDFLASRSEARLALWRALICSRLACLHAKASALVLECCSGVISVFFFVICPLRISLWTKSSVQ